MKGEVIAEERNHGICSKDSRDDMRSTIEIWRRSALVPKLDFEKGKAKSNSKYLANLVPSTRRSWPCPDVADPQGILRPDGFVALEEIEETTMQCVNRLALCQLAGAANSFTQTLKARTSEKSGEFHELITMKFLNRWRSKRKM